MNEAQRTLDPYVLTLLKAMLDTAKVSLHVAEEAIKA